MIRIRAQTYDKMLKSLRAESQLLLRQAIGEFAVSSNPSLETVVQKLELALTSEEKMAIRQQSVDFEKLVAEAFEDLKQTIIDSGEPYSFGNRPMRHMTSENPALTLLSLSIEELMINLNRYKQRTEDEPSNRLPDMME